MHGAVRPHIGEDHVAGDAALGPHQQPAALHLVVGLAPGLTVGQTETISLTPSVSSSATMAAGSGQAMGSKRHSPMRVQWKKSATITSSGRPRR